MVQLLFVYNLQLFVDNFQLIVYNSQLFVDNLQLIVDTMSANCWQFSAICLWCQLIVYILPLSFFALLWGLQLWWVALEHGLGRRDGCAALGQPLEPLEGVIDKDPILDSSIVIDIVFTVFIGGDCRNFEVDIGKFVKIGGVIDALDVNVDGGGSLPDVLPIHRALSEKGQGLDFVQVFDSLILVSGESSDCLFCWFWNGHLWRENQGFSPIHDLAMGLVGCFWAEWRVSDKHLVHNNAQTPPITAWSIASLLKNFRSCKKNNKESAVCLEYWAVCLEYSAFCWHKSAVCWKYSAVCWLYSAGCWQYRVSQHVLNRLKVAQKFASEVSYVSEKMYFAPKNCFLSLFCELQKRKWNF